MACGGGGGKAGTGWSSLQADLLLSVFALLPSDADRVRFRAVCGAWGGAAAAWPPRPWLVGSRTDRSGRGGGAVSSFWLSPCGGLLPFAANVPAGFEYLSSSRGYIALADPRAPPKAIVLFNPVTGRRIHLPPIAFFKRWLDLTTVVLSADPEAAAEWAAVAVGFPTTCLAYYSSATGAWTRLDFGVPGYAGVEHYNGRFYVAFKSQICVCEVDGDAPAVIPLERVDDADGGDGSDDEERRLRASGRRVVETHLVECDGQLLLISVHDDVVYNSDDDMGGLAVDDGAGSKGGGGGDARAVEVHRVEWLGDDGAVRLVRETDLGWNALFLGRNRAFALSVVEFPACRVNCVYLVDRQGHPDGVVRVLDMENQWARREETICPDDVPCGSSSSAGWARRGWFFPNYG
ncbi:hypothetical protein BAE44_0013296 [Dichanthelium oligosanthes]|uniref:KIB1-4 beta-propeller domain-containing protein n=1 Tax=Dichanthelium oligosanthes TaxID=888268 RepID=A0A1E5VKQ4_9POAL|nr:hypothetical protein BAE44_0013296 [Dichanthelium oligosanthes]